MAWMQMHEHELFLQRMTGTSLVFASCRCRWEGPMRSNDEHARQDFKAHREGRALPEAGDR